MNIAIDAEKKRILLKDFPMLSGTCGSAEDMMILGNKLKSPLHLTMDGLEFTVVVDVDITKVCPVSLWGFGKDPLTGMYSDYLVREYMQEYMQAFIESPVGRKFITNLLKRQQKEAQKTIDKFGGEKDEPSS